VTLFVTVLTPLTQYLTVEHITPDFFQNMIAFVVTQEMMSREQAESYFSLQSYLIQSVIFTPLMGVVTSAVVALFVRKKPGVSQTT
jgi:hypothetical protein